MEKQNKLIIFFGLPGAGKTFVGKLFAKHYGFFYYDGDNDLTEEIKRAVQTQSRITDKMRDGFFEKLNRKVTMLLKKHPRLVVTQTFIKEKYRIVFLQKFPNAQFVLVRTPTKIREQRLAKRRGLKIEMEYARAMVRRFEKPAIAHTIIDNSTKEGLEAQLDKLHDSLRDFALL